MFILFDIIFKMFIYFIGYFFFCSFYAFTIECYSESGRNAETVARHTMCVGRKREAEFVFFMDFLLSFHLMEEKKVEFFYFKS